MFESLVIPTELLPKFPPPRKIQNHCCRQDRQAKILVLEFSDLGISPDDADDADDAHRQDRLDR